MRPQLVSGSLHLQFDFLELFLQLLSFPTGRSEQLLLHFKQRSVEVPELLLAWFVLICQSGTHRHVDFVFRRLWLLQRP